MKSGDLTTLGNLKDWLASTNYVQASSSGVSIDRLYARMITRVSNDILSYLERPWLLPRDYVNEMYDGSGSATLMLRNWPVLSVSALSVSGMTIPMSADGVLQFGFNLDSWNGAPPGSHQLLSQVGTRFWPGKSNILVSYRAGYQVTDEPWTVPAVTGSDTTSQIIVNQPYGIWAQDVGVKYADTKAALTLVSVAPTAAGQYRVLPVDEGTPLSEPGIYEFYQDDATRAILISYGYIPGTLEENALEMIAERLVYRNRVGEVSRTVNQQITVRYDTSAMPAHIKRSLQPFKNELPI